MIIVDNSVKKAFRCIIHTSDNEDTRLNEIEDVKRMIAKLLQNEKFERLVLNIDVKELDKIEREDTMHSIINHINSLNKHKGYINAKLKANVKVRTFFRNEKIYTIEEYSKRNFIQKITEYFMYLTVDKMEFYILDQGIRVFDDLISVIYLIIEAYLLGNCKIEFRLSHY